METFTQQDCKVIRHYNIYLLRSLIPVKWFMQRAGCPGNANLMTYKYMYLL